MRKNEQTESSPLVNEPYKVESWAEYGRRLDELLYAGNLQKARSVFTQATKGGRFTRLTIRHRKRVPDQWRALRARELKLAVHLISINMNPATSPTFSLCVVRTRRSSNANKNPMS